MRTRPQLANLGSMRRPWSGLLLAFLLPVAAAGEIYRTVDENGNVVYTDQPTSGAKQMELPELSTYESQPTPPLTPQATSATPAATPSAAISFVQPTQDETVYDNEGNLSVAVRVEPPLQAGQKLALQIDDRAPVVTEASTYRFTEVHRGTHTIKAWVQNSAGAPAGEPASVTFHMRQASSLFRGPGPQSGAVQRAPMAPQAPRAPNFPAN